MFVVNQTAIHKIWKIQQFYELIEQSVGTLSKQNRKLKFIDMWKLPPNHRGSKLKNEANHKKKI